MVYIICCGGKSKNQIRVEERQKMEEAADRGESTLSENILIELSIDVLGKLYQRLHEEKENFAEIGEQFFKNTDKGIQERMLKRMELREKFIEEAVEIHLKTLKYETGDSYNESVGITKNLSLKDKLTKLDQVGAPITKALVPSIGSIDQV